MSPDQLIDQFINDGTLKTPSIIKAFKKIKRSDFLPPELVAEELVNAPLPIGAGQTNSQPYTVAFMLELLQAQEGDRILDIGSGSGWTTALLANIIGSSGQVYAIERIAELKEFGQNNLKKYNFSNVEFFCQDGHDGLPKAAPFDRILVSAAAIELPPALKSQLKVGGRLVIPTADQAIKLIIKRAENKFEQEEYPGFIFVPLIRD